MVAVIVGFRSVLMMFSTPSPAPALDDVVMPHSSSRIPWACSHFLVSSSRLFRSGDWLACSMLFALMRSFSSSANLAASIDTVLLSDTASGCCSPFALVMIFLALFMYSSVSPLHTRTCFSSSTCCPLNLAMSRTRSWKPSSSCSPGKCIPCVLSSISCLTRTDDSRVTSMSASSCCCSLRCFCLMVPMAWKSCPSCACSLACSLSSSSSLRCPSFLASSSSLRCASFLPSSCSFRSYASTKQSTASSYLPCALKSSDWATSTLATLGSSGSSSSTATPSSLTVLTMQAFLALSSNPCAAENLPSRVSHSPMPSRMRQWRFLDSASLIPTCASILSAVLKCCSACATSFCRRYVVAR
mmetsp:Transcript_8456/g.20784  ORF Transcript_8456/g.20784 Transcript_8456/m.20784 type:complete len:357 (-) Transcript_8456:183-1253(-)